MKIVPKSASELKLILLPPKELQSVTCEDIENFYKRLTNILIKED